MNDIKTCNLCKHTLDLSKFEKASIVDGYVVIKYVDKCIDCRGKQKRNYNLLKDNHCCPLCQTPTSENTCCINCKILIKEKRRDKTKIAKSNGLCICCFKEKAIKLNSCINCYNKRQSKDIISRLYTRAKFRAKNTNKDFDIAKSDIILPEYCPILHIKLQLNANHCEDNSYSLDRIDPSKGYVKGNIQVISQRANQLKNNATIEELEMILKFLKIQNMP